ncbi:MAG: ABC transporter ATP-binding protein [Desulfobacteraceae bacterium]|nr:MAG: ABC transporter ATP-binding protein [Desulfobacteraceae bacterium]
MDSMTSSQNVPILRSEKLSVQFGALRAVNRLDFHIYHGELFGLIGPNGAGKTTVFNAITNTVPLSGGDVHFDGKSLHGLKTHQIAVLGIVRVFQAATIFSRIPTMVHIMNGLDCRTKATMWSSLFRTSFFYREEAASRKRAEELIEFANLQGLEEHLAESLTWAQQKRLMLATALAAYPKLILLDEPFAGMTADEIAEMIALIRAIRSSGMTVFIIDHNMKVMQQICDRIMVLNFGQKLTEGPPDEVSCNPHVIEAYLGYE